MLALWINTKRITIQENPHQPLPFFDYKQPEIQGFQVPTRIKQRLTLQTNIKGNTR